MKPLIRCDTRGFCPFYTVHDPHTSERIGQIAGRWSGWRHRTIFTARVRGVEIGEFPSAAAAKRAVLALGETPQEGR